MSLFPIFLKLEGRKCLVVGAGKTGESKIRSLLVSRANVHVVAPWATPTVTAWDRAGVLQWSARVFHPSDLDGVFLVVAATSTPAVNDVVYQEAQSRGALCNVVDVPERCDFYYPAVVRRGDLQVAISTGGHSPALAQKLRREFERQLTPVYAGWLERLGKFRKQLFSRPLDPDRRRALLHEVATGGPFSNPSFDPSSAQEPPMEGKVFLVGAGPGNPELLTVRALRLLQSADVVLHDDLISPQILELASKNAHVRSVGKRCGRKKVLQGEIDNLLIAYASFGVKVVRLKSGDPLLFGRAGEEIAALRKANVEFEIIPGISSASAAAAALEASLTQRNKASAVVFLTSHQAKDRSTEWKTYLHSGATLAIYMPGSDYVSTAANLVSAGIDTDTPCAVVSRASTNDEQIHRTTVRSLPDAPQLPAPTILLVGEVFRTAETEAHHNSIHKARVFGEPLVALPTLEIFADNQVF